MHKQDHQNPRSHRAFLQDYKRSQLVLRNLPTGRSDNHPYLRNRFFLINIFVHYLILRIYNFPQHQDQYSISDILV